MWYNTVMEKYTIQKKSLRYIENFDEDFSFSDYTPHELYEMNKDSQSTKNFKEKYFDYYDDIKSHTNKKQDW